ncbi:MAG: ferrochelatase [Acidimicrobiales bacterium]|nr:ferrochelatase [Acidimicrobiales bacterium]
MPKYDAILFVSFGGPEAKEDVLPFLNNVTSGRGVPPQRLAEVQAQYDLFDGVSPINQQNRDLIAALNEDLQQHGLDLPIYFGNRNWKPFLQDAVGELVKDGHRKVLAFVTSAFGSYSGCRQYQEDIQSAVDNADTKGLTIDKIRLYWNHPKFFEAVSDQLKKTLIRLTPEKRTSTRIIYTAHSIPSSWSEGSPYISQLQSFAEEISALVAPDISSDLVFQSRSGPPSIPWLGPDILDYLDQLDPKTVDTVVVTPIGFISDHMEVQFDLDTQAAEHAQKLGIQMFRTPTVGIHQSFVAMIRELVEEASEEAEAAIAFGKPWRCSPTCCDITAISNIGNGGKAPTRHG